MVISYEFRQIHNLINMRCIHLLSSTDCAYGDRSDCGTFPEAFCYVSENNLHVCCALCQNAETGIAGMYILQYNKIQYTYNPNSDNLKDLYFCIFNIIGLGTKHKKTY